ncbi:hypothetical protein [Microvirga tunisiensis]|uniref:hypothetical protein n=1 Tax=Microvirga tunisiensis TaxID=2108360 RepID=UPI00128C87D9|nr:transposase [Microvirga tunisiensis]
MQTLDMIGIDLAKNVFQLHGASQTGAVLFQKKLSRGKLLSFLATQPTCTVAMEACASAHYWGRQISTLGHRVRLIAPYVDGPLLARVLNRILDRIVCGHMSGLLLRSHLTAAKMASATRVPNKLAACHCRGAMRSFACLGSIDHTICSCSCKSGIRSARESCGLFPCPTDLYPAHATSVDAACAR